jgi:hypothetical protein
VEATSPAGLRIVLVQHLLEKLAQADGDLTPRLTEASAKASDGKETRVPAIVPVTIPILGRALSTSANWSRINEFGELVPTDCPWAVVEEIGRDCPNAYASGRACAPWQRAGKIGWSGH